MASNDVSNAMTIAAAGLKAQSTRMRVVAQNIANAGTTPSNPKEKPYQRQVITFKSELDRATGASTVKVARITKDNSQPIKKYDPTNPAADPEGYVQTPNIKPMIETMDMHEAQRSYDANLSVIEASRVMLMRTVDLLRN